MPARLTSAPKVWLRPLCWLPPPNPVLPFLLEGAPPRSPPTPWGIGLFKPALSCLKADDSRFSSGLGSSADSCAVVSCATGAGAELPSSARFMTKLAAAAAARDVSIRGIDEVTVPAGLAGAFFLVAAPPAADCFSVDAAALVVVAAALVVDAAALVVFGAACGFEAVAAFLVSVACFRVAPPSAAAGFFSFAIR